MNSEVRKCQSCKKDFTIFSEDFDFYKKISVPPPTWCPHCRMLRRFAFRNERMLFRRTDAVTGKEIFSGIPPEAPVPVYNYDYYISDAWDPISYGREYDFKRPFFEQFRELWRTVPWRAKSVTNMVNSEYCDQCGYFKNSYLCFNGDYNEDSAYCIKCNYIKNCFDIDHASENELCYDSLIMGKSYRTFFSVNCEAMQDAWFSKNCSGCSNVFGCVNLRDKSYYIFNEPYTKEVYFEKLKSFNLGSYQALEAMRKKVEDFWQAQPNRYIHGLRNVNSTGEMIYSTKNVKDSYIVLGAENVRYSQMLSLGATDSYDYTVWGNQSSQVYESLTCGEEMDTLKFCFDCWPSSRNLEYSVSCGGSSNLFGCVGLKKKQYCIFNKQYTKHDYEGLRAKIIEHMNAVPYTDAQGRIYRYGEFFPPEFSIFAYNQTVSQDLFPLKKEEAEAQGYRWQEPEAKAFQATMKTADIPDHIQDASEALLQQLIQCADCGRAYRIIKAEYDFLKSQGLPIPHLCSDCRHIRRMRFINPPKFWHRRCQCENGKHGHAGICPIEFETAYAPDKPDILYCEQCYQLEIL